MLLKIDLKSAYRIVPVHPADRHLLGLSWDGSVYVDQALPFGLRSAPKLFTAVADAVGWALVQAGVPLHLHYLDDFIFFIPPGTPYSHLVLPHVLQVLHSLGVPVAAHKVEGPATVVTFLGVIVDTARFELRLPQQKLDLIRELVRTWRGRRSGSYRAFESLVGHLAHAATVIRQGRVFMRYLYVVLSSVRSRCHHVHLDATARADLLWWEYFLQSWNGMSFFLFPPTPTVHVHTDASGSFGCAGVLPPSQYFQLQWSDSWNEVDITTKELVPVVIAAAMWGRAWFRTQVCFHVDNMGVVAILRRYTAGGDISHHLIRCLYFYASFWQFEFSAEHIPGVQNTAADAVSQNNLTLFSSLFPQATRVHIPVVLQDLLLQRPDWGSVSWIDMFVST